MKPLNTVKFAKFIEILLKFLKETQKILSAVNYFFKRGNFYKMVTSKGEEKRTELPLPHDVKLLFVSLITVLYRGIIFAICRVAKARTIRRGAEIRCTLEAGLEDTYGG